MKNCELGGLNKGEARGALAHFPQTVSLIKDVVETIDDSELLQEIAVKLSTLQTLEMAEARKRDLVTIQFHSNLSSCVRIKQ